MTLDHTNILCEQEELKLLNQHLQTQVTSLQNNSARTEGDLVSGRSPNLLTLNELIQKWIVDAKLPQHLIPTTRLHDFLLSKDIQKCELLRKFSTPTFDRYTGASDLVQHIRHF